MSTANATPFADLGDRIRAARKRAGLSHDRLAETVGTGRSHLIRLEKGLHRPKPEMLARIAEATGQELEFFTGTPPMTVGDDPDADGDDPLREACLNLYATLREQLRAEVKAEARLLWLEEATG